MMITRLDAHLLHAALATLASMPHAAAAPPLTSCDGLHVLTMPERPRQGALFRVRVDGAGPSISLNGSAAGEPLHFIAARGRHEALAAAPIDAKSPMRVTVACTSAGRTDSLVARVALARATYPLERLRVAPQFSAPPDSALEGRDRNFNRGRLTIRGAYGPIVDLASAA